MKTDQDHTTDDSHPVPELWDLTAEGTDHSHGVIAITVFNPRTVTDFDAETNTAGLVHPLYPLIRVDGQTVELSSPHALITVVAGTRLVEVMENQCYVSKKVDVAAEASLPLWIGVGGDTAHPYLLVGPEAYARQARRERVTPWMKAAAASAGLFVLFPLLFALGLLVAEAALDFEAHDLVRGGLSYGLMAVGIGCFFPLRSWFTGRQEREFYSAELSVAPEEIGPSPDPAHAVTLLQPGTALPSAGAGIILSMRPAPASLARLMAYQGGSATARSRVWLHCTDLQSWLAAPLVYVDGHRISQRWGTVWVPLSPGRHRLTVVLPGFSDPLFDDPEPVGPRAEESLEVEVALATVVRLRAEYNVIALARSLASEHPESKPLWLSVLDVAGHAGHTSDQARRPQLTLRELGVERVRPGTRLLT
ncbi:hypothetical protein [Natronoglycomyces albus]|uniref:Uncharacterized protein n=1 Tax=Natronoglycomyces albus TaxID=2811108 RepID=A0A895XDP1_9ACTN|nr:hypothetical protein [Natronoglycomyces albus]QSB03911.1 hypothetical protein JQS30_08735 [Natronoglycomyces albus]